MTAIVGAGVACAEGFDWRTLAAREPRQDPARTPAIPAELDVGDARLHRLMSQPARLLAVAARRAIGEAGWRDLDGAGYFVGAGLSPVPTGEIEALMRASWEGGLSMARLGRFGLRAYHPLRTFTLLPNFTMCHSALLEGTRGPNTVLFSRGAGTVAALDEAIRSLDAGECERALVAGADSPFDPFEVSDQRRAGTPAEGMVAGEGAAVLLLSRRADDRALARVTGCAVAGARRTGLPAAAERACRDAGGGEPDVVVLSPWGEPARGALRAFAGGCRGARVVDVTAALGETFAAAPALAWTVALAALAAGARRALVVSAGLDGQVGAVTLEAAGP